MPFYRSGVLLVCFWMLLGCALAQPEAASSPWLPAATPRDATYFIDGEPYPLKNGQVMIETAPGSASKTIVQLVGKPVSGDLDGDGAPDAAVLLVQTTGGSGSFYYVAAALNREEGFFGTEALFIGDRIAPQQLAIRYGIVLADYTDRRPGEAMAISPSQGHSKYLVIRDGQLVDVPLADGEVIAAGEVVIGHEVRSFTPCGANDAVWLVGDSPALPAMQLVYHRVMSDASPYTPLFMVLTGRPVGQPADGFGNDFPGGFRASQLVHALADASCTELNRPSR